MSNKYSDSLVEQIRAEVARGVPWQALAERYGIPRGSMASLVHYRGSRWEGGHLVCYGPPVEARPALSDADIERHLRLVFRP